MGLNQSFLNELVEFSNLDVGAHISHKKVILSGESPEIEALAISLENRGLDFRKLSVAGAFHSRQMQNASKTFHKELLTIDLAEKVFHTPVFSTISARCERKPNCDLLIQQIVSPVLLDQAIDTLCLEYPGSVLIDLSTIAQFLSFANEIPKFKIVSFSSLIETKGCKKSDIREACKVHGLPLDLVKSKPDDIYHCDVMFAPILPLTYDVDAPVEVEIEPIQPSSSVAVNAAATFPEKVVKPSRGRYDKIISRIVDGYDPSKHNTHKWFEIISDSFLLTMIIHEVNTMFNQKYGIAKIVGSYPTPELLFASISDGFHVIDAAISEPVRSTMFPSKTYLDRTRRSRQHADDIRPHLADRRSVVAHFPRYPIVAQDMRDSAIIDVDGRKLVDLAMGFGVNFFGHKSSLLKQSIEEVWKEGSTLGPTEKYAGELAKLLCSQTGHERATFVTTGSEAVMVAIRLARATAKKTKVVLFKDSYHGHFDGVLGFPSIDSDRVFPSYPGTPTATVEDIIILEYRNADALEKICERADEIAAVVVEPVQSANLHLPDKAYLQKIREITYSMGIFLIFDEILTGFRGSLRGASGVFDVMPDVSLFGKMLGNGLPIAAICGVREVLDQIDGGGKQERDFGAFEFRSVFMGGTYNKNGFALL